MSLCFFEYVDASFLILPVSLFLIASFLPAVLLSTLLVSNRLIPPFSDTSLAHHSNCHSVARRYDAADGLLMRLNRGSQLQ